MSKHLEVVEALVQKPVYILRKDMVITKGGKRNSSLVENVDSFITDITDEKVFVNGKEYRIKRLFVQSTDSGEYSGVGWVINSEMNYCMVCSVAFGMFTYAHHCRACGNVVCHNCSSSLVEVYEIRQVGPQRVCNQCFWGQEVVYAVQQKPVVIPKFANLSVKPAAVQSSNETIEAPVPVEDPEKTLKLQQQAEFQRQAIARLEKSQLARSQSVLLPSTVENNSVAGVERQPSLRPTSSVHGGAPITSNPMRAQSMPPSAAVLGNSEQHGGAVTSTGRSLLPSNRAPAPEPVRAISSNSSNGGGTMDEGDRANAQRVQKMLFYGPLSLQSPTPGFVLKTKRSDLTKVFVNVCTHPAVPYRQEEVPSSGAGAAAYDLSKVVYMLVGPPLEYQNERDRSYCVIYDVVVHPDEVYVCSIDSTGIARNRLCNQSLELIAVHFFEALDPSYKILKISSNYKGRVESTGAGRTVKTQPIVIPCKDAFYALAQMTTHPSDMEVAYPRANSHNSHNSGRSSHGAGGTELPGQPPTRDTERSPMRGSMSSSKQNIGRASFSAASAAAIMAATKDASTTPASSSSTDKSGNNGRRGSSSLLAMSFISAGENSRSGAVAASLDRGLLETSDSLHSNLDRALKVTVKPVALAAKATSQNFGSVLEDLKNFQYSFRDVVITPEAGFVISAQRANRGQQIFVNVCHHPLVAMLTVKAAAERGQTLSFDRYPNGVPCPCVVGAIDNDFACADRNIMVSIEGGKCIVIDLVIPSAVMLLAIQDPTGDLRDQLAVEMLEAVSRLNVQFDSNFTLPLVEGGYVGKSPLIFPVINQTEEEKRLFAVSFVGKFHKQGHGVRSWKERLVQIGPDSRLKYFDLNSNYKGDFCIDDCSVTYVPNADCSAPPIVYPFKLTNFVTGGEFMYCHVPNSDLRELFSLVIVTKTRQLSVIKDLTAIPDLTTGWLRKQGHVRKNWKRRFFVLSYGVLRYYEKNGQEGRGSGENELGAVDLKNATVKVVVNSEISSVGRTSSSSVGGKDSGKDCRLSVVSGAGKDLLVEAESQAEKNAWFDAVKAHILYANKYN